jgi:hypothetical protein
MTDRITRAVVLMRQQDIALKRIAEERMTSSSSLVRQAVAAWLSTQAHTSQPEQDTAA